MSDPAPLFHYTFGSFRFEPDTRRLIRDGQEVRLGPRAVDVLLVLVENAGRTVTRDELIARAWNGTSVEDQNVTVQIHEIRDALGDEPDKPFYIETITRRGYQFICLVQRVEAGAPTRSRKPSDLRNSDTRHWRSISWAVAAAASFLALAAGVLLVLRGEPPAAVRVVAVHQLTTDGRNKEALSLLDPTHVLISYLDGQAVLDLTTGRTSPSPFKQFSVFAVSPVRHEALAESFLDRGAEHALWRVPLNGDSPHRMGALTVHDAVWSPSGQQIAFSVPPGLYVAAPDGAVVKTLATFSGQAEYLDWPPDGRMLRFSLMVASNRTVTSTIWEVRPDGTGLRQVIQNANPEPFDARGTWLPDGRTYVFESKRSGTLALWALREGVGPFAKSSLTQLTDGQLEFSSARVVDAGRRLVAIGRSLQRRLVRFDVSTTKLEPIAGGIPAEWVEYSPDGRRIAYIRHPEKRLWIADADGSNQKQLSADGWDVDSCAWSPDNSWIALRAAEPSKHHKVYLIGSRGGTAVPLTPDDVEQGAPTWSSDSKMLAFGDVPERHGEPAGNEGIHIFDLSSKRDETLSGSNGLWTSRWSPGGRYLVALTIQDQGLRLFDWATHEWRSLGIDHVENPTWSRDGVYIYFSREGNVDFAVSRLRISDGAVERLVDLKSSPDHWSGLAPDNSPVLLAGGSTEVYILDLQSL